MKESQAEHPVKKTGFYATENKFLQQKYFFPSFNNKKNSAIITGMKFSSLIWKKFFFIGYIFINN